MSNRRKHITLYQLAIYVLVLFFPILPSYTVIMGRAIYDWVVVFAAALVIIGIRKIKRVKISLFFSLSLICYILVYLLHGEFGAIITIIVRFFLPIYLVHSYTKDNEARREEVIHLLLVAGLLLGIEAIVEVLTEFNVFSLIQNSAFEMTEGAKLGYRYGRVRAEGPFGTCLSFGLYFLFINSLCIIQIKNTQRENIRHTKFFWATYFFSLLGIYLTTARFTLFLAIILNALFVYSLRPSRKIPIVLIAVVLSVIVGLDPESGLLDSIYSVLGIFNSSFQARASDGGHNLQYRIRLFTLLSGYISQHPFIGMGYANKANLTFQMNENWIAYSVDNNYLSQIIEYGIIGLIANVLPIAYSIVNSLKLKSHTKDNAETYKWLSCLYILYAISLINVYQMGERRIFCIMLGLLASAIEYSKKGEANVSK